MTFEEAMKRTGNILDKGIELDIFRKVSNPPNSYHLSEGFTKLYNEILWGKIVRDCEADPTLENIDHELYKHKSIRAIIAIYLGSKMLIRRQDQPEYFSLEKVSLNDAAASRQAGTAATSKKPKKERFKPLKKFGSIYELTNASQIKKERATALLKSLAVLRGGAKQAAFGTDVSPKVIIMAGMTCGNPIFNTLFEDNSLDPKMGKNVVLDVKALKEIISDYKDRICTPVIIGIRTGYMKNEQEIRNLDDTGVGDSGISIVVTTPVDAAKQMTDLLPDIPSIQSVDQ